MKTFTSAKEVIQFFNSSSFSSFEIGRKSVSRMYECNGALFVCSDQLEFAERYDFECVVKVSYDIVANLERPAVVNRIQSSEFKTHGRGKKLNLARREQLSSLSNSDLNCLYQECVNNKEHYALRSDLDVA